jgi:hypothetical protein
MSKLLDAFNELSRHNDPDEVDPTGSYYHVSNTETQLTRGLFLSHRRCTACEL